VHKRIGVSPKLYLSAVSTLKALLMELLSEAISEKSDLKPVIAALDKLFMFDITLVFDTYIRSLVSEIEISKEKLENYAHTLEETVKERTRQLEEMTRVDPLTGLLNVRYLRDNLTRTLRAAKRRSEPVSIVYIDINDFKTINDTQGHQRGDEVLAAIGDAIRQVSRIEDSCFRYGGDEFCLILSNCNENLAEEIYLTRLNAEITRQLQTITISAGIVQTGPDEFEEADALIHLADERMYATKKAFKSRKL
jgi:diguanylate cyclase (GGDEF)-like protein